MNETQISFLKNELVPLLSKIPSDQKPQWGNMTVQQMVEHLSVVQRLSSGKTPNDRIVIPEEKIARSQQFLMSEQPLSPGVQNPLFPKDPPPVTNATLYDALKELQAEIDYYITALNSDEDFVITHPYFGRLNKEMNLQAAYKHALHHLRQFGVDYLEAAS